MVKQTLRLLGPVQVKWDIGEPPRFRSQRTMALLGYLAAERRAVARKTLEGLFWPDETAAAGHANLRRELHNLGQMLPGCWRIDSLAVQFSPSTNTQVDIYDLRHLIDAEQWPEASTWLGGDFLEGVLLDDNPEFEAWLLGEQERRRQTAGRVLMAAAQGEIRQGDATAARRYLRRLLRLAPWNEEAHRLIMRLLAQSGRFGDALKQYEQCRAVLAAELDVAPAPATKALYERIKTAQAMPPPNLPPPATPFIGRRREVAEIIQLLHRPATRLVTLTGAGGSGKTRLALRAAESLAFSFIEGICFVDLASLSDPLLAPAAVASALGINVDGNRPVLDGLVAYLGDREVLLLLDNCEHLVDTLARLADNLLRRCPELRILATSREPLGIAGEVVWLAPMLSLPPSNGQLFIEDLQQYDAVQLFIERASAVLPGFELNERNAASLVQLCRRLDGMPLAIELAAARVRLLRVEQILARLDNHMDLLADGSRVGPPRHQTLRAAIDWSYNLLPPDEQRLLRRLSVFSGGFTLEAVEGVCDEEKPGRSIESLAQLVKKSLVVAMRSPGREARYDLHETIYQYAWARLEEEGEANRLLDRHVEYFFRQAEQAQPHLYFDYLKAYREWWGAEYSNLRAALSRAFAGQALGLNAALPLCARMASYWAFGGPLSEGHYWLKIALKKMWGAPAPIRAALLLNAGFLSFLQGDPEGDTLVRKSLPLYQRLKDDRGVCRIYVLLGNWALEVEGNVNKAKALYDQALARAVVLEDSVLIFRTYLGLGDSALLAGNFNLAREFNEKMLPYAHDVEERRAAKFQQASIMMKEQDFEQATTLLLKALALARSINSAWYIANTLKSLGDIARIQRNYDQALSFYSDSLAVARANNLRTRISIVICYLGHIVLRRGDSQQGARYMRESLEIHRGIKSQEGIAWNLWGFGLVAVLVNMPIRAARLYAAAEMSINSLNNTLAAADFEDYARDVAVVRDQLGENAFAAAWAKGQAMSPEQAISYALEENEAQMSITREPARS